MYAYVRGTVLWVEEEAVVLASNGLGLRIRAVPAVIHAAAEGEDLELFLHHLVREESEALVGFTSRDQVQLFATLLDVSGVGPKVALALLATHGPERLRRALVDGDETLLAKAPGVGRRLAARIIVELGDRMSRDATAAGADGAEGERDRDLQAALRSLGFPAREAREMAASVSSDVSVATSPLADRLRAALKERA